MVFIVVISVRPRLGTVAHCSGVGWPHCAAVVVEGIHCLSKISPEDVEAVLLLGDCGVPVKIEKLLHKECFCR